MKKTTKFLACGTSVLFAAALSLQAQTSSSSSGTSGTGTSGASSSSNAGTTGSRFGSGTAGQSSMGSTSSSAQTGSQFGTAGSNNNLSSSSSTAPMQSSNQNASNSFNGSASGSAAGSLSGSTSPNSSTQSQASQSSSPSITYPANGTSTQSTYANSSNVNNSNTANSNLNTTNSTTTQQNFFSGAASTATDAQVTTFVQQLDTQGPAVVQRISTQVGDLACSNDTIENLVNALHDGQTVTINANGKSATFNPQGAHLGYGEAYIALALAAQELRNAGINSCATPEQWQSVLFGGPLNVSQTSSGTNTYASASSSNTVQGIVTLHNQGQGWGQIAQTANVQLGQIVSNSNLSSNLNSSSTSPSPTGFSSAEASQTYNNPADSDNGKHKGEKKHHWWSRDKKSDTDANASTDASSSSDANNGTSASTHADTSGNANSSANSSSTQSTK